MSTLPSLVLFCFAMSVTPGPNNVMVLASAARHGVRRTLPHMLGITFGFPVMLAMVGAGIGALLLSSPPIHRGLEIVGVLVMLWFALRIARAGAPHVPTGDSRARPLTFLEAALFQWANPKAWLIAIAALALFVHGHGGFWTGIAVISAVFVLVCLPCLLAWAALGRGASALLRTERRFLLFNRVMAALLVLALIPLVWHG
jgi:threonine/homoserine/homoserine lactone efflux protein